MTPFLSQITFLNFRDYNLGKHFASQVLNLQEVYDIGWAVVYQTAEKAFLGIVDHSARKDDSIKTGMLVSLTTGEIEAWHTHISKYLEISPIKEIPDAGLKSFFFTGPEGYQFEIQQFLLPEAQNIFNA